MIPPILPTMSATKKPAPAQPHSSAIGPAQRIEFYQAFVERDSTYEGQFYAGIRSTGIFCRPTCSARKAKIENCEFFRTAEESLLAGYRPCKRCHPRDLPGEPTQLIRTLLQQVEADPSRRWKDHDLRSLGIDPSTARRQFKTRLGMTFIAYARARRLGAGLKSIRSGEKIIHAQLDSGYESSSGFRDAFSRIMGSAPHSRAHRVLYAEWIPTPLGPMIALADEDHLHLLEFIDRRALENEIHRLREREQVAILPGRTDITTRIETELAAYFDGGLDAFLTPVHLYGSDFQKSVLQILRQIPYGETRSYAQQAALLGKPQAIRAVARANGMNQLALIIPCHRVIGSNGKLTGYSGGLARKKWLLQHERKNRPS